MARREFLQLAKTFKPDKHLIAGWYLSEKLDGTRCLWDGGLSRGLPTLDTPWASCINPRTVEVKPKIKPVATGLWSRYGNPIMAPDWFLDKLPPFPCDGELWAGRGNFQLCRSICAGDEPDERFDQIQFAVFSSPPLEALFQDGLIKNTNMLVSINQEKVEQWMELNDRSTPAVPQHSTLEQEYFALQGWDGWGEQVYILQQIILHNDPEIAASQLSKHMNVLLEDGAEGAILRDPKAIWKPKRVATCLKFKPWEDAEGTVTGFTSGRRTDKGSKLLGLIGSLVLDYEGKRLELSGLTNEERKFATDLDTKTARLFPGDDMASYVQGKHFKTGDVVSFKYRELSDDGIPKEARYWRHRGEE